MVKFTVAYLLLLPLATTSAGSVRRAHSKEEPKVHRDLQTCQDCCISIETIDFKNIPQCNHHEIKVAIRNAISTENPTCPHNHDIEAQKLTGKTDTGNALNELMNDCEAKIESCVSFEEIDLANIKQCHSHYIREMIRNKQAEKIQSSECSFARADWQEAMVMTSKPGWNEAELVLSEECYKELSPCVNYNELLDDMKVIGSCDSGKIRNDIEVRKGGSCQHRSREEEAIAIVWNLEKQISPNTKVVWSDNDGSTTNAEDYLVAKCEEVITPCTTVGELDMVNIRQCSEHYIREEIRNKQDGCDSQRADWEEAILITGESNWVDARDSLLDLCWDSIQPCVEYSKLEKAFETINFCDWHQVINEVQNSMESCGSRSREEEAIAIVWNLIKGTDPDEQVVWWDDNDDTIDASAYLVERCEEKITPCLENTDALFDLFTSVMLCDDHRVLQEIDALHGDNCLRNAHYDAILLAPEEYTVWRDGNEGTQDAADYMHEQCVEKITPCASLDELLDLFESTPTCYEWQIKKEIQSISGEGCRRNADYDGILLAKELILRKNSTATEFPIYWHHGDSNIWTAYSELESECRSRIKPCAELSAIYQGFGTIQYCDQHRIRHEIEIHQSDGCRRNAYDDAVLITPEEYAIWGDDNDSTQDARIRLMNECSQRAQPSFGLSELETDFIDIDQCHWNSILKSIEARQSSIVDSTVRRRHDQDAIWLAGEILKVEDPTVLVTTEIAFGAQLQLENPSANFALMSFGNQDGTYNPASMLETHCKERIQSCVEDLQQFDESLKDIRSCNNHGHILNLITDNQKAGCARAHHHDAPLVARDYELNASPDEVPPEFVWGGNVPELNSYDYLNAKCLEKIETCIPSLDDFDMSHIIHCDHGQILNLIKDIQKDGCKRSQQEDAILIVRDMEWAENPSGPRPELRVWWSDDENIHSASDYLLDVCHSNGKSCVPSYDDLNFEDVRLCHDHWIREEITLKQPDTCSRHSHLDAIFLVRAKLAEENANDPGYVAPSIVWRDNNPDTFDAYDYMMNDCNNRITACSSVDDLDFENIEFCDDHRIRNEISLKQDGCSSDRPDYEDAILMTGADTWHDDNPDTTDAREILITKCEEEITPCVDIETLDYRYIRACDGHHIRLLIDETRDAMGDACPSSQTRSWHYEAILATGADVWHDNNDDTTDAEDILIAKCMEKVESCTLKSDETLEVNGCDWISFKESVKRGTHEDDCRRNLDFELYAMNRELTEKTGKTTDELLNATCTTAWSTIDTSTFEQVDTEFTNDFMDDYTNGLTHLNENTGNFRGLCVNDNHNRDGEIGYNISEFRMYEAQKTLVEGFNPLDKCDSQAIMCCFGRDRQFGDNNGNCRVNDCEDADPADNSNLCKIGDTAYPNNDPPENEIHCHGLAWGEDENDFTRKLKFNNFFFVSLYDHMYSRGYVERTIRREDNPEEFRMCDCVEKMPPVTRSDCTEVTIDPFVLSRNSDNTLLATPPESLDVQFNACRGDGRNNDLSTYIKRLVREGRFSEALQQQAYRTLVGYENPNDNDNEAACEAIL